MAELTLTYELDHAGWAVFTLEREKRVEVTVSYLHDSLRDLAQSAIKLNQGRSPEVIFMDEPGEMRLDLRLHDDTVRYELRWYEDWASWGMDNPETFEVVDSGTTAASHFVAQVISVLSKIYNEVGTDRYLERWINHEFPTREYEELIALG